MTTIRERYQGQYDLERTQVREGGSCDLPILEPDDFYRWYDKATTTERLEELQHRIDWLAGHIYGPGPNDDPDAPFKKDAGPYWGSWELYMALDRMRFLAYGVTGQLPANVMVLTADQEATP